MDFNSTKTLDSFEVFINDVPDFTFEKARDMLHFGLGFSHDLTSEILKDIKYNNDDQKYVELFTNAREYFNITLQHSDSKGMFNFIEIV